MTRAALLAVLVTIGSGACLAGETAQPRAGVGAEPWVKVALSPAFAPDDAYLFAEPPSAARLDQDAAEAAALIDRERLSGEAEPLAAASVGRVASAFADFTTFGSDGEAYASLTVARGAIRVAVAPIRTPSLASFALASR